MLLERARQGKKKQVGAEPRQLRNDSGAPKNKVKESCPERGKRDGARRPALRTAEARRCGEIGRDGPLGGTDRWRVVDNEQRSLHGNFRKIWAKEASVQMDRER